MCGAGEVVALTGTMCPELLRVRVPLAIAKAMGPGWELAGGRACTLCIYSIRIKENT